MGGEHGDNPVRRHPDVADYITVAEAARRVGWHVSAARRFAREQRLAIPWPTENRVRVKWTEFKQAVDARRAGERSARESKQKLVKQIVMALHHDVRC